MLCFKTLVRVCGKGLEKVYSGWESCHQGRDVEKREAMESEEAMDPESVREVQSTEKIDSPCSAVLVHRERPWSHADMHSQQRKFDLTTSEDWFAACFGPTRALWASTFDGRN